MEREGWTIDVDAVGESIGDEEEFDRRLLAFEEALARYGAAVATNARRDRYGARFSLDTDSVSPVDVLEQGLAIFHDAADEVGMPVWQVVHCEVLTYAEDDAEDDDDSEDAGA